MRDRAESKTKAWLVLCVCLAIAVLVSGAYYLWLQQQTAQDIQRIRTIYTDRTENFVNGVFHKTDVLAAVVVLQNGDISEQTFDRIARIVYTENSGIRGVQYMPGAVVTYSYPVEGNEAVMGKNFLELPDRAADCQLAIDTRSIALSGPYYLIQGGLGLVARNPVFLTDASGNQYFWGFSAIVLDLPDAVKTVGLDNLPESGYDFQLYCVNENGERLVIEGNPDLDMSHAETGTISVPNHEWTLAVSQQDPWKNPSQAAAVLALGVCLSLLAWRQYLLLQRERSATRSKDMFFSDISHDMRTPLNAIIGFTRLAREDGNTPQQRDEYLDKVEVSSNLLMGIIDDTLTISKASSGKIVLHPEPWKVRGLIDSVIVPISDLAEQKGITLSVDDSTVTDETILIDRLSAQKIFLNLLSNAVKFTPAGGHVRHTISQRLLPTGEMHYTVTVQDDGIGMSDEFQKVMFEPFKQENRPGFESMGTGLGLSITKQMVDLMGGTIDVASREGAGTTFTVQLQFPVTEQAPVQVACAEAADVDLSGKTVLLCEDNLLNREIAQKLLEEMGAQVLTAPNGQVGVEAFSASPVGGIDAVLMDVRMPVMNGYEATRAIRALDRSDAETVPIIAMTADAFADDVQRCLDAGMDAHIAKPVDPDVLGSKLSSLMK